MTVIPLNRDELPTRTVPSMFRRAPEREVYNVNEVAKLLGLSRSGAYELVRDGTIPAKKLGGRWVIPKARFHAWLNEDPGEEPEPVPATPSIPMQRRSY